LPLEEPFAAGTIVGAIIDGVGVEALIGDDEIAEGNADVENPLLVPFVVVVEDEECEAISDSNRRSLSEKFKFSGGSGLSIGITFGFGFGATGGGPPGRLLLLFIDVNVVAVADAGDEGVSSTVLNPSQTNNRIVPSAFRNKFAASICYSQVKNHH
jgi:hypothetical protein